MKSFLILAIAMAFFVSCTQTKLSELTGEPIKAVFTFYPVADNPNSKSADGSFKMSGVFNKTKNEIYLKATKWVRRPRYYDVVALSGILNDKLDSMGGDVTSTGCKHFSLKRAGKPSKTNNDIYGQWKGLYTCFQGKTGLTLTIIK